MTTPLDSSSPVAPLPADVNNSPALRPMRYWPVVVLLAGFWAFQFIAQEIEMPTLVRFVTRIAVSALVALGFAVWWFLNRRFSRRERFAWFGGTLAALLGAGFFCHPTFGIFGMLFFGLPWLLTAATAWLLVARNQSLARVRRGLLVVLLVVPASFTLMRSDGLSGEQQSQVRWRWSATAEELFLRERARSVASKKAPGGGGAAAGEADPVQLQPGDWPGFRGPAGNGEVRGLEIDANWNSAPPRVVWRQRVGPAWS